MRQFENKDKAKADIGQGHISKPKSRYGKPRIRFFNSFEEMNEADAIEMAGFTPIQNFEQATQMILAFYAAELQMPMDKKIHFVK